MMGVFSGLGRVCHTHDSGLTAEWMASAPNVI